MKLLLESAKNPIAIGVILATTLFLIGNSAM